MNLTPSAFSREYNYPFKLCKQTLVRRLMGSMGLRALYRHPRTSQPAPGHQVYPYLLRGVEITQPNQVWTADITYIPMARGFLYLVVIMDWYSRYVLAWAAVQYSGDRSVLKPWK